MPEAVDEKPRNCPINLFDKRLFGSYLERKEGN
jgi:hypothetical protein